VRGGPGSLSRPPPLIRHTCARDSPDPKREKAPLFTCCFWEPDSASDEAVRRSRFDIHMAERESARPFRSG
jgi:hypothetical protein